MDFVNEPHTTGTTIMAVQFNGGVILGADSRTTTGTYVANRYADKITPITDKIFCCRSGSAADTQAVADLVKCSLYYSENTTNEEPKVINAANEFRNYCYDYRASLLAGIIVAGWDNKMGGQVYEISLGGMCTRRPCSIGGSGSSYIMGLVKEMYKENMEKDECIEFVFKCIKQAIKHDGSSGGIIRICVVTSTGVERDVYYSTKDGVNKFLFDANEI